jgi:hypothetical protein
MLSSECTKIERSQLLSLHRWIIGLLLDPLLCFLGRAPGEFFLVLAVAPYHKLSKMAGALSSPTETHGSWAGMTLITRLGDPGQCWQSGSLSDFGIRQMFRRIQTSSARCEFSSDALGVHEHHISRSAMYQQDKCCSFVYASAR